MSRLNSSFPAGGRGRRLACLLALCATAAAAFAAAGAAAPAGSADLKITKTDSPDPVGVRASLTYSIKVENLGPDAATGVSVTDTLPKGVDYLSATTTLGTCSRKGRKVTCTLGSMPAPTIDYSGPPTISITVVPRRAGTITNTAAVKGDQKDAVPGNNSASATTLVTAVAKVPTCRGVPATVTGTRGSDVLGGTGGPDVIVARGGADRIRSGTGRDLICAGAGRDHVASGRAADRVFGGPGRGRLRGGRGFDRCLGGGGRDSIRGCER